MVVDARRCRSGNAATAVEILHGKRHEFLQASTAAGPQRPPRPANEVHANGTNLE